VVDDESDKSDDVLPELVGDRLPVLVVQIDGVHQLAVDVELELVVCAVADTHRL
jgi:hypothetical protein